MIFGSFKLHLVPERPVKDLKVGMSVLFKIKEEKNKTCLPAYYVN